MRRHPDHLRSGGYLLPVDHRPLTYRPCWTYRCSIHLGGSMYLIQLARAALAASWSLSLMALWVWGTFFWVPRKYREGAPSLGRPRHRER